MLDYTNLKALATVVETGGFERAARVLCITQSAVSQRIRALEERIGQSLLIRSVPVTATPAGKRLLRHYHQVALLESELGSELNADDPHKPTQIAIAVNADSLATWFLPALSPLFARYGWLMKLIVDDESYTHNLLKNGEAVGCVTTNAEPMAGCSAEFLGVMRYRCVATPEFIERFFAAGLTQDALAKAPAVIFSTKDRLHERFLAKHFSLPSSGFYQHTVPSSEGFLDAICQHLGYGMVGHLQADKLIAAGVLIDLCPSVTMDVALYWQHWNIKAKYTTIIYRALAVAARQVLGEKTA
ncbi:LysR family transcriptional regulator ArgP [Shewanella sp. JM162201]|uniref:LysR family transcriptional regulator ArgP n=1 Tax=Shewanella jiangmenensis TaxID=2837387 RepID=A0ABS5V1V9_9GAMM|nr:LysR family transcriptional regulator ArgP [Shewanella jiangmenensis]MBT1443807.1 LysR family transcriptional regulator ArgP [Shewanella jiangmenensis]